MVPAMTPVAGTEHRCSGGSGSLPAASRTMRFGMNRFPRALSAVRKTALTLQSRVLSRSPARLFRFSKAIAAGSEDGAWTCKKITLERLLHTVAYRQVQVPDEPNRQIILLRVFSSSVSPSECDARLPRAHARTHARTHSRTRLEYTHSAATCVYFDCVPATRVDRADRAGVSLIQPPSISCSRSTPR